VHRQAPSLPPPDPPEIWAVEFKEEFRRSAICSVSATIGMNWSIFSAGRPAKRHPRFAKKTVTRPRIALGFVLNKGFPWNG
jgi:hypothetical protein